MFTGPYGFFDYKYNIPGYSGQDYDGGGRLIYLIASILIIIALLVIFRKTKKETVLLNIRIGAILFTAMYIIKTTWESYFDIKQSGGFNIGILPFDTCSVIMIALWLSGFAKGKLKEIGDAWIVTGSVVGGLSNLFFLRALYYYPFFTFGAFYSMAWHLFMVFFGLWLVVTRYVELSFKTVVYAFILQLFWSIPTIVVNTVYDMDFMLYRYAGGAPLLSSLGDELAKNNLHWLTTIIMMVVYFGLFALLVYLYKGLRTLIDMTQRKKPEENKNEEVK